jgi:hypothetical protein
MQRFYSRAALMVAASMVMAGLVGGCAKDDDMSSRTHAILTDREAVRLAELHLDDTDPGESKPRDVVAIDTTHEGKGHLVAFQTFFDEDERAPKMSRLVEVDHDGDVRELTFED